VTEVQEHSFDVIVIGSGPAGVTAARRAAELGARTALVERYTLGGMATLDGPVPVRTLAHAARLAREARQLATLLLAYTPSETFAEIEVWGDGQTAAMQLLESLPVALNRQPRPSSTRS
jgi:pyruvate/2-oxoglutarate dehydrogenase complex dihydrolipoamide dehydrogenase (E3) component